MTDIYIHASYLAKNVPIPIKRSKKPENQSHSQSDFRYTVGITAKPLYEKFIKILCRFHKMQETN